MGIKLDHYTLNVCNLVTAHVSSTMPSLSAMRPLYACITNCAARVYKKMTL